MSTSRATFSRTLSLLASFIVIFVAGCEVPQLNSLSPETAAQGESVQLTLAGKFFTSDSRILIDGNLDGTGTAITLGELTLTSPEQLLAALQVGPSAAAGAHAVAVGDRAGISDPQYLFVQCAGCPPPPRLLSMATSGVPELMPLIRDSVHTIRLHGSNFSTGGSVGISVSGPGLSFPAVLPAAAVSIDPASQAEFIDLPITVAADAPTGRRVVTVNTSGGTSNPQLLTVLAAPLIPRITGVTVAGSSSCALRPGLNDVYITGNFFDLATEIRVQFVAAGRVVQLTGANTVLTDPRTIFTQLDTGSVAPNSFSVVAAGISGESAAFPVSCNPEQLPILRSLSPAVVTRGTSVYIKCEGENFSRNPEDPGADSVFWEGRGVEIEPVRPGPVNADPEKVLVLKLTISQDADPSVTIWIFNQLGQHTNPLALRIEQPPPRYYIARVTPEFITQGGVAQITVTGSFFGTVDYSLFRFSTPGLTLSNPRTDSVDISKITFDVRADRDATLTNDDATNLLLGNPIAFRVLPSAASPTPTPAATPTATPAPGGPVITSITPARVGKGVEVLIKCQGSGFGTSRQVITDPPVPTTTYGVASAAANPDNVVVAKILPQAAGPLRVRVKNLTLQTTSEEIVVFVDDPAPGAPVARGTTGDGVHRGAGFDLTVVGTNLQGLTDTSWGGIPGLTFSNTTSSATSATVHITADGTAPLTADEATNLTVTTSAGQSPPFLFRVFQ